MRLWIPAFAGMTKFKQILKNYYKFNSYLGNKYAGYSII
ncbi:MAG: hypothetical protein RL018_1654 [Pseudomonadota bacterium]